MPNNASISSAPSTNAAKFALDKSVAGGITTITLRGTLDHAFDGQTVAESIRTQKLVVSMRDVRRIASWGMSSWMDFLRICAAHDVYLVECSSYAASQLNLVTGLAGHAKLVSLYAAFRCSSCNTEFETLFVVPRDRGTMRNLSSVEHECATCGGQVQLDEHPAAVFEAIAQRPPFDIDDEVLAFLRSRFKYELPIDLTRFRAHRRVRDSKTYLRISGNLSTMPGERVGKACEGTTVVDMVSVVYDPKDCAQWHAFVAAAQVSSLQLTNCPAEFIESAVSVDDLRGKVKVRTLVIAQECLRCQQSTTHVVDVAETLEQLVTGASANATCQGCQAVAPAELTNEQAVLFRALPAREHDESLDKFVAKAQAESTEKLEDCLALPPKKPIAIGTAGRTLYVAAVLTVLLLVGLGIVVVGVWKQRADHPVAVATPASQPAPPSPTFVRPEWILSDEPSSAYCHDLINRLMCVGISAYRPTRDEAVADANNAALEELVSVLGLKISDSFFRDTISPTYSQLRLKALEALQVADLDRTGSAYAAANDTVDTVRRRVAETFEASGGAAVPAHRTDWYWEEYAKKGGTEMLVFVRYDVSLDAMKALVDTYSSPVPFLGSTVTTAFPALAWIFDDFAGGAMIVKLARPFAEAGIAPHDIIMAVDGQPVTDATSLARRYETWKQASAGQEELRLTVRGADGPPRIVAIRVHDK